MMRAAATLALLLSACGGPAATPAPAKQAPAPPSPPAAEHSTAPAPAPAAATQTPPPPTEEPLFRRTREMMGTIIAITVVGVSDERAAPGVEAAFAEMQRLEGVLSEWREDSEISRINAAAGKGPVQVSEDTLAVVQAGLDISRWSEGAFDLSWAALRGMYTFQPGDERVPDLEAVKKRLPLIDHRKIRIDHDARTVELLEPGMQIGTGGIAKGYALDRAAEVLEKAGLSRFMLFGGGQVQVLGKRKGRGWRVGIQHPRRPEYFGFLETEAGSISTSGDYEHAFMRDGKRWHHIIDLKTGLPVEHTSSVTVLDDSGIYADALSTAIFVLGAERAIPKLKDAPGNPRVVIVDSDMRLHTSPGVDEALVMRMPLTDGRLPGPDDSVRPQINPALR
jgi:thiamine biosynthesis lipoprotein